MKQLSRVVGRVFNTPLAIAPDKAAVIAAVVAAECGVVQSLEPAAALREDGGVGSSVEMVDGGIAIFRVEGTLVERSSWLDSASGLTAYDTISAELARLEADGSVRGVVMSFDSPGGEVSGMFECAVKVAGFTKPLVAAVNFCTCSAAYLLAAQCDEIYVSESSIAGSIGIIAQHMDMSGWDAQVGLKYSTIYAGARKNDGNPHEPLSKGAAATIQADVDDLYGRFVMAVSSGRRMDAEAIRGTEAGIFRGELAIEAGLADAMGGLDAAIASLAARLAQETAAAPAAARTKRGGMEMSQRNTGAKAPVEPNGEEQSADPKSEELEEPSAKGAAGEGDAGGEEEEKPTAADYEEIASLCAIAGRPELAADYISGRTTVAQVRKDLMAKAAQGAPSVRSGVDAAAGARNGFNAFDDKQNPLLADAKRRKEMAGGK